ncbi:MAG: glycosyltransferase family 2 protein [Planctomycetes bacterium]|nr:glycosyltransferase family 2 protein [Planctomycetota bacterium]
MTDEAKEQIRPVPPDVREDLFVVIAAFNEVASIEPVAREVRAMFPNVVVVDDGSTDGTLDVARRSAKYVLRHVINRGQGAALQTGIEFALRHGARFILTFDADGQHRVEDIPAMLEPIWRGECEITLGSRFLGKAVNIPSTRRNLLRLAVLFTKIVNRVKLTDAHNGLRAFSRRAAETIHITMDRMAHASELIDQIRLSGLPFREVPVEIRYTVYSLAKGQSSRGALRIVWQYLLGRVFQ